MYSFHATANSELLLISLARFYGITAGLQLGGATTADVVELVVLEVVSPNFATRFHSIGLHGGGAGFPARFTHSH